MPLQPGGTYMSLQANDDELEEVFPCARMLTNSQLDILALHNIILPCELGTTIDINLSHEYSSVHTNGIVPTIVPHGKLFHCGRVRLHCLIFEMRYQRHMGTVVVRYWRVQGVWCLCVGVGSTTGMLALAGHRPPV